MHSGVSAGESIFSKMAKIDQNRQKMAKNGLFSTVFGNFDPEESGITPTSPTYIDSVGENGTFETYLTEFPVWGVLGGPKKLVFGHRGDPM